jgi:peroxiredoxin
MRPFLRRTPWRVTGLLLLTFPVVARRLPAQASFAYEAVVGSREALFTFALPYRTEWRWNQPTTQPGHFEYRWDVRVADSSRTYRVGFLEARFPGAPPAQGSLEPLLDAGQTSFFVFEGGRGTVDPGVNVEVIPGRTRLWVSLQDPDAVARLFAARPPMVTFHSLVEGLGADSAVVRVTYLDAGEPGLPDEAQRQADPLGLGEIVPDFELPVRAGPANVTPSSRERLSSYRGQPVVLYLWSGTCPVARGEYPELVRFAEKWTPRGVRFLSVAVDHTAEARSFLQAQPEVPFPALAATANLPEAYRDPVSPTIVVIDAEGRIVHHGDGAGQLAPELILEQRLASLTASRPATGP